MASLERCSGHGTLQQDFHLSQIQGRQALQREKCCRRQLWQSLAGYIAKHLSFYPLSHFLPHCFGLENLLSKHLPFLLEPHHNNLSFPTINGFIINNNNINNWLKHAVLKAANKPHAPYSGCSSGVAVMDTNGNIYQIGRPQWSNASNNKAFQFELWSPWSPQAYTWAAWFDSPCLGMAWSACVTVGLLRWWWWWLLRWAHGSHAFKTGGAIGLAAGHGNLGLFGYQE